jgi:uncharacterized protein YfaS (alpha-2-macroglobulin family)
MSSIGIFGHLMHQDVGGRQKAETEESAVMESPRSAMAPAAAETKAVGKTSMLQPTEADSFGAQKEAVADEEPAPEVDTPEDLMDAQVRTKFADTAFWSGNILTDSSGMAEVDFSMPENLTGWKAVVWAMGHGTKVGQGSVEVVTRKDLILRLQAPRFFVETDEVVLTANVHNYLTSKKTARVVLEFDGGCLALLNGDPSTKSISIDPNGEKRVDWRVQVVKEGEAVIRMKALTDEDSDAVQMHFPVYVHGMAKQVPKSGVIRADKSEASIFFDVPAERRVEASHLELRYSPSLAGAMVDALPYLTSYPYGCT